VIAVSLIGFYLVQDRERLPLDDAARRAAPGRFARLSDGSTHYELSGPDTGRVVVLLSGSSVPYYLWDPTRDGLVAAGFRVLRFDYFGRGFSDRPDVPYDFALLDRQLVGLLDTLRIGGQVDLAGVSMGASVGAHFATRHPERTRTLTFIDPGLTYGPSQATVPEVLMMPGVGEYLMTTVGVPQMTEGQSADFYRPGRFPDWPARYRTQTQYAGFRRAMLSAMRTGMSATPSDFPALQRGSVPLLIVWGREDATVPFARSDSVRRSFPRAEFHAVDSAGHIPQYERPEAVNPLLVAFLRAH
jgi:pimeloyl-ACP methyl ester carboxylesterase